MNWRRKWQPTPVSLPGESQGQGSLVGCRLWGCTESDMTERLHFHFSFSCIGEGNGNPLQCPCLENPRDREAWWAAIYGVAQSRTRLKQLSSSSSSSIIQHISYTVLRFFLWIIYFKSTSTLVFLRKSTHPQLHLNPRNHWIFA